MWLGKVFLDTLRVLCDMKFLCCGLHGAVFLNTLYVVRGTMTLYFWMPLMFWMTWYSIFGYPVFCVLLGRYCISLYPESCGDMLQYFWIPCMLCVWHGLLTSNEVYGSLLACGDSDDKEELTTLHIVKDRIIILYCWR